MAKATVKKVGRKRRAAGWTLLTLAPRVILARVWVASGCYSLAGLSDGAPCPECGKGKAAD